MPPGNLIAAMVEVSMMGPAQRDGELVSDFSAKRSRLGEAEMVRVGGTGAA